MYLYKHMAGGTEETHEKSQAQQSKFRPKVEPRISQMWKNPGKYLNPEPVKYVLYCGVQN
jgi:hypothetical protein